MQEGYQPRISRGPQTPRTPVCELETDQVRADPQLSGSETLSTIIPPPVDRVHIFATLLAEMTPQMLVRASPLILANVLSR